MRPQSGCDLDFGLVRLNREPGPLTYNYKTIKGHYLKLLNLQYSVTQEYNTNTALTFCLLSPGQGVTRELAEHGAGSGLRSPLTLGTPGLALVWSQGFCLPLGAPSVRGPGYIHCQPRSGIWQPSVLQGTVQGGGGEFSLWQSRIASRLDQSLHQCGRGP